MSDTLQFELHPDADQLSAFSEGLLPEHERLATMAHLADCASCREVVFLAQQAMPEPITTPAPEPVWRRWFAPLPMVGAGAALLAGAALIVITLHAPRSAAPPNQSANVSLPAPLPTPPPPPAKVASEPVMKPLAPPAMTMAAPAPKLAARPAPARAAMGALSGGAASSDGNAATNYAAAPAMKLPPSEPQPLAPINLGGGVSGALPGGAVAAAKAPLTGSAAGSGVTTLRTMHGVAGGTGTGVATRQMAAAPAAAARPAPAAAAPAQDAITMAAAADEARPAGSTINSGKAENLPIDGRNITTMAALLPDVAAHALPSKLPAAVTATDGKITVAIDTAGTVFRSSNNGKRWKQIKQPWQGKPVSLKAAAPAVVAGDEASVKPANKAKSLTPTFTLTTDSGIVWTSGDGEHWQRY